VATPTIARVQKRHVQVVQGNGFRLIAWDATDADKSLCFRLQAGTQRYTQCEAVIQRKARLNFASFANARGTAVFIGGLARRSVVKVVATFTNGQKMTLRTVPGRRYRGRQRGHVKFWAGRHAGAAKLKSLVGKNSRGAQVDSVDALPPPPEPMPPNPCGCHGRPLQRIVCPLTPCPE
jgi:hypothetical protein